MNPLILSALLMNSVGAPLDALPDVSLLASELATAYVTTSNQEFPAGTRGIRFNTASVNYGAGRLELRGGTIVGNTQLVNQRIYRTDGTFWDRAAGSFTYHSNHGHIHFDDWTIFRLRQVLPGNGVGSVVAQGAKTSFCILEIRPVNTAMPGHNVAPGYTSCGQLQGLRPGWADIYGASLFGQVINLTGVADGIYWLEGDIDPNNQVLESDETNNQVRIQVAVGAVPAAVPDLYEQNDTIAQVNAAPVGGTNSPNLGLVRNQRMISNLSMEDTNDWYKLTLHAGAPGSFIQMESPYLQQSNLNFQLCDINGAVVRSSTNSYSWENISLSGIAAGTYFIRVFPAVSGNNPNYRLFISPTPNRAPLLTLNQPPRGTTYVEKAINTFPVTWNGSDPDNDPKFVSLFRSRVNLDNGAAVPITGYQNMPNAQNMVNMNTAEFGLGQWFIMGAGSDEGAQTLSWAPGNVFIYIKGDLNMDGHVHKNDLIMAYKRFRIPVRSEPFRSIMDMDRNGVVNAIDIALLENLVNDHDH